MSQSLPHESVFSGAFKIDSTEQARPFRDGEGVRRFRSQNTFSQPLNTQRIRFLTTKNMCSMVAISGTSAERDAPTRPASLRLCHQSRAHPSSRRWRFGSGRCMTWAVPTQLPARPQTVTPGSIRGLTSTTGIAFRETNKTSTETGRSSTLLVIPTVAAGPVPANGAHTPAPSTQPPHRTRRRSPWLQPWVLRTATPIRPSKNATPASIQGTAIPKTPLIRSPCPLVLSLGEALRCEPLVSTWGNAPLSHVEASPHAPPDIQPAKIAHRHPLTNKNMCSTLQISGTYAGAGGPGQRVNAPSGWLPVIHTRCWIPALQSVKVDPTA